MRLAVQRALRDYEPGEAECRRRWFAAERTGASPVTLEYGYPHDPDFWVHRTGTPDAVCVVFYGEPHPATMHVFGPVGVAALVDELDALGETDAYGDVFCEAAMQLSSALRGEPLFDSPRSARGPRPLKPRSAESDPDDDE
jgi:hypothetical protein